MHLNKKYIKGDDILCLFLNSLNEKGCMCKYLQHVLQCWGTFNLKLSSLNASFRIIKIPEQSLYFPEHNSKRMHMDLFDLKI